MTIRRASATALATALLASVAALSSAPAANAAVVPTWTQTGSLTVQGDAAANEIIIGRDQLGVISVNGQVPLAGGVPGSFPTVLNVETMAVLGVGGDDVLRMDETNGPLPAVQMFGGVGNDTIIGGSGADQLFGQDGNDTANGFAGDDTIVGASGNDVLFGGSGTDRLFGSAGDDTVDGDRGDDDIFFGDGNDRAIWDPGDGSDRLEGEVGFDTFEFRGSGADEQFRLSPDGERARLTRDVGSVRIDAGTVERVNVDVLGGHDTLTLDDLTGTAVQELRTDLEAVRNGGAPDTGNDRLILNGAAGADIVSVLGQPGELFVLGLSAFVTIQRAEAARDELTINAFAGNDRIEAGSLASDAIRLVADGGVGGDTIFGTNGGDVLLGGDGGDFVDGQRGNDTALLGPGDDTFSSEPGDGSDQVAGEAGTDGVHLRGSSAGEQFRASANGTRPLLSRSTGGGSETLDAHEIERLNVVSFGGADTVTIDDLTATGVTDMDVSLFDFGVPGGQTDAVIVNGTGGPDRVGVTDLNGVADVAGLAARIRLTGTDAAGDRLEVRGHGGNDVLDSTRLSAAEMRYLGDGGAGNDILRAGAGDDVLIGSDGADTLLAGGGDNVAFGGAGDDVLRGEEGDDVLDGGLDFDTLIGGAGDDVLLNGERVSDD